jgi:NAD-dependent SIR2 family protein deacetylase
MSRVVILGAGASAGYVNAQVGLPPPVSRTFFSTAASLMAQRCLDWTCYPALSHFLSTYYRTEPRIDPEVDLDIEDVLTVIEISGRHRVAREQLLRFIAEVLDVVLRGPPCDFHRQLLASLTPADTIITFNWDLLVDNLITLQRPSGPNYGTDALVPRGPRVLNRPGEPFPMLLKLHGSFNWMECSRCRGCSAHLLLGKVVAAHYSGQPTMCESCNEPTEPIIIPPTLLKRYESRVIESIWRKAHAALKDASEIMIIGYSLPPTDFKAKWLFMESRANALPLRSLSIFDRCSDALKDKFGRVFGIPAETIRCVTGGIKEASCSAANTLFDGLR